MSVHVMSDQGADIDMITGLPLAPDEKNKGALEKVSGDLVAAQSMADEVRGIPGQEVLATVLEVLEERIGRLVMGDPECKAVLRLVERLNFKANIARKQAIYRIQKILGNDTPEWVLAAAH